MPDDDWQRIAFEYWCVWKPFVGVPNVVCWWWTAGAAGMSPYEYLDHAVTEYDKARRAYLRSHPGTPARGRYRDG